MKKETYKKDSPTRSIMKAVSWRLIASGATFLISFVVFRHSTNKTDTQVLQYATAIASVDVVIKLILYYLHERLWTNIYWGKYWSRQAWKRHYRKMHSKLAQQEQENEKTGGH